MPNPIGKKPEPPRPLPQNIDQLIRAAMSGETTTEAVRAAFDIAHPEPLPNASRVDPHAFEAPTPPVLDMIPPPQARKRAPSAAPQAPPVQSIGEGLGRLAEMIAEARSAWYSGRGAFVQETLLKANPLLQQLVQDLTASAEGTTTMVDAQDEAPLTSTRSLQLFIEGGNDPGKAGAIARALDVDAVTARMLAVCRHPCVALRDADAGALQDLAHRFQQTTGLRAAVIAPHQVREVQSVSAVLGLAGIRNFQVSRAAVWQQVPHDPLRDGRVVRTPKITLAVPGEVVIAHYKGSEAPASYTLTQEDRIGVVDLYGPDIALRFVEGITDFTGMPGYDVASKRRSFRGFLDRLGIWFPNVRKLGPRVCRPAEPPRPVAGQPLMPSVQSNGWDTWDEHSRLCTLL